MSRPAKQNRIKALVINPFARTIYQEEIENTLEDIYRVTKCDCIAAVYLDEINCMYVDDEGLLVEPSKQAYFAIEGADQPFAGIGLVVGTDAEGNSADHTLNILELGQKISFLGSPRVQSSDESGEIWAFV